jgi:hypothetical protein
MNKLSNAIKCVNCRQALNSPVLLPCGCSLCKKHTIDVKGPITCYSCEIDHPVPPNGGFPHNKALDDIIDAQICNLDFGKEHQEAKHSCENLDELLSKIEELINDPSNFTYEAIGCLKSVVQLKGEEMKMKIDEKMTNFISKLDEY